VTLKLTLVITVPVGVANSTARGLGSCDTVRWLGIPTARKVLGLLDFDLDFLMLFGLKFELFSVEESLWPMKQLVNY
jgi:hypothetical protein